MTSVYMHPVTLDTLCPEVYIRSDVYYTGIPGEAIPVEAEEEIFAIIEFPYKAPHERNFGK